MSLSALFKKSLKNFDLDVSFSCPAGKPVVMIGTPGGGKPRSSVCCADWKTLIGILRFASNLVRSETSRKLNRETPPGLRVSDYNLFRT